MLFSQGFGGLKPLLEAVGLAGGATFAILIDLAGGFSIGFVFNTIGVETEVVSVSCCWWATGFSVSSTDDPCEVCSG